MKILEFYRIGIDTKSKVAQRILELRCPNGDRSEINLTQWGFVPVNGKTFTEIQSVILNEFSILISLDHISNIYGGYVVWAEPIWSKYFIDSRIDQAREQIEFYSEENKKVKIQESIDKIEIKYTQEKQEYEDELDRLINLKNEVQLVDKEESMEDIIRRVVKEEMVS